MSELVHEFPVVSVATGDMRLPLQYLGPGNYQGRSIDLDVLREWMEGEMQVPYAANITLSVSGAIPVPAGRWALWVALTSATAQTGINIGETPSGNELALLDLSGIARVSLGVYGGTLGATVYISGLSASTTISVLIV